MRKSLLFATALALLLPAMATTATAQRHDGYREGDRGTRTKVIIRDRDRDRDRNKRIVIRDRDHARGEYRGRRDSDVVIIKKKKPRCVARVGDVCIR